MDKRLLGVGCAAAGCLALVGIAVVAFFLIPALVNERAEQEGAARDGEVEAVGAEDARSPASMALLPEESSGLELVRQGGQLVARQPSWGFSFEVPGDFEANQELEQSLNDDQARQVAAGGLNNIHWWALASRDQTRHLQAQATKGIPAGESELRDFAAGLHEVFAAETSFADLQEEVSWNDGEGLIHFRFSSQGVPFDFRCVNGHHPTTHLPTLICLQVAGFDARAKAALFDSLQVGR